MKNDRCLKLQTCPTRAVALRAAMTLFLTAVRHSASPLTRAIQNKRDIPYIIYLYLYMIII